MHRRSSYNLIAADCPWPENGGCGKGASDHYHVERYQDMPEVVRSQPLWRPDKSGCLVFLWTTVTSFMWTGWLIQCLKITPVTKLYWIKDRGFSSHFDCGCLDDLGFDEVPGIVPLCHSCGEFPRLTGGLGMGQYVRHDVEEVIVCRYGSVKTPNLAERDWLLAPSSTHSKKPQEMFDLFAEIGHASGLTNRAELFARDPRPGWHVCGDEVGTGLRGTTAAQGSLLG